MPAMPPGAAARSAPGVAGSGRGEVPLRKILACALRCRVWRPVPRAPEGGESVLEHDHVVVRGRDLGRPSRPGGVERALAGRWEEGAVLARGRNYHPLPTERVPAQAGIRLAARPGHGRERPGIRHLRAAEARGLIEVDDLPAVGEGAAAFPYPRAHGTHTLSGPARLAHRIPPGSGPKPRAWPGSGGVRRRSV